MIQGPSSPELTGVGNVQISFPGKRPVCGFIPCSTVRHLANGTIDNSGSVLQNERDAESTVTDHSPFGEFQETPSN
jgi:hypothetical protein